MTQQPGRHLAVVALSLVGWVAMACGGSAGEDYADTAPPLSGDWRLAGNRSAGELAEVEIAIEGDSAVSGFSGCNRFFGSLSLVGDSISFGPLASTRRACQPAVMELEGRVLTSLDKAAGYRATDSTLTLVDQTGHELLVWNRIVGLR